MISGEQAKGYAVAGGLVVGALVLWRLYRLGGDVFEAGREVVTEDLNPTSDQNVAYRGTNGFLRWWGLLDEDQTLGTAIYEDVETVKGWFSRGEAAEAKASDEPLTPAEENVYRIQPWLGY